MSRFLVTLAVLTEDGVFRKYLLNSQIKAAKKGGTFVGNYSVAPEDLRKYGIILPKGGMILPDIEPGELEKIIAEPEALREAEDIKNRRTIEDVYLNEVREMLAKSGVSDIKIVVIDGRELHNIGLSFWHKSFLARDEEKIFPLHSEEEPFSGLGDDKSYKPWRTSFTELEKVEAFLREEARLIEPRKLFVDRINWLVEKSHAVGQQALGEDGWDRPRVELLLHDNYTQTPNDWGFSGRRCKSSYSAHRITYRNNLFELTERDIARLEREVGEHAEKATSRQEMLKSLFLEAKGVFARTNEEKSCFAGHSLATGKAKFDGWTELHYFLKGVEVTEEEYKWLQSRLTEIPVPEGFIRVKNGTNDLLSIPEMPGRGDVLVVEGKSGSSRGEWSYDEWFRGHPSKCQINFWHKGTARQIRSVTLNGKVQESNSVDISQWTDPRELAKRALRETGMRIPDDDFDPVIKFVEALAEVYRQQIADGTLAGKPAISIQQKVVIIPQSSAKQPTTSVSEPSNRQESGNGFGLGMGAWDALNGLKL